MKKIDVTSENWMRYCSAVGDYNTIHWDDDSACSFGLEGRIAPGMFIASHIIGDGDITSMKARFSGRVYDSEQLEMSEQDGNYRLKRGDEGVCEVRGVKVGEHKSDVPKPLRDVLFRFPSPVSSSDILDFQESVGASESSIVSPGMYLASLSGPALLGYGSENGFVGIHASQSFTAYSLFEAEGLTIEIGDMVSRDPMQSYDMRWLDVENRIIASGKAMVLPLKKGG